MAAQFARPYHFQTRSNGPSQTAPNAALLIDFDNVTMGIRSDLSKELKNLLNSDIIKGKVAVQRAYADWRRYPQYVVPLAESSIDLIFAPAYGSAKKNATDIRLAIDALELVFTRPEIGTFILLSGDSDFSSLVLKLKEYGKYVIGVGIRESASDILVQNCDEYYSYSVLSGLTKDSDEDRVRLDPWELVEKAVRQMAQRGDVMRSDRLKQVMLELDGNFNEKELGYSKFSRFLSDAVARDRLLLRKGEHGQWEVSPPDTPETAAPAEAERPEARPAREEPRGRRGGRGRDHERTQREQRAERVATVAAKEAAPEPRTEVEPTASVQPPAEPRQRPVPEEVIAGVVGEPRGDLRAAYELLRRAVEQLCKNGEMARDSDVKRRMLELHPGWDESTLGFSKFSRFLRQAHDAEVIDLHRSAGGNYQLTLSVSRGRKQVELPRRAAAPAAEKQKQPARAKRAEKEEQPVTAPVSPAAESPAEEPAQPEIRKAPEPRAASTDESVAATAAAPEPAPAPGAAPQAERTTAPVLRGIGARLGTRGRSAPLGPPPVLPGQAVAPATASTKPAAAPEAETTAPAEPEKKTGRKEKPRAATAPAGQARAAAAAEVTSTPAEAAAPAPTLTERYSLPNDAEGVTAYVLGRYKGVGPKTIAVLLDALGAANFFDVLQNEPDRVREALGAGRRAELVLSAWKADLAQRTSELEAKLESAPRAAEEKAEPATKPAARRSSRSTGQTKTAAKAKSGAAATASGRRGTRARTRPAADDTAAADAESAGDQSATKPATRRKRRSTKPAAAGK